MTRQITQRRAMGTSEAARLRLAAVAAEHLELIGQRIRERREQLAMSRADVARKMPGKTNENQVYRWETGRHRISDDTLEALAKVLEVAGGMYFLAPAPDKTTTPTPLPAKAVEGELAGILKRIEAQLDEQNRVLAEIKSEQTELRKLIAGEKAARDEAEKARSVFLADAQDASRALADAAQRLEAARGTRAK